MDFLIKMISKPEKTTCEKVVEYVYENPAVIAKGAAIGIASWYAIPFVTTGIVVLPYLGFGYYVYKNTNVTYSETIEPYINIALEKMIKK